MKSVISLLLVVINLLLVIKALISHEFWQQNSLYTIEQYLKEIHLFFLKEKKRFSSSGLPYDYGSGSKQIGGVGCCSSEAQRCSQHWQVAVSLRDSYIMEFLAHLLSLPSPWPVHESTGMTKRSAINKVNIAWEAEWISDFTAVGNTFPVLNGAGI